uniref:Uncharacterized protein n=1 Tax=Parascaris equorum TaxID=6256 RepID=A0A914RPX3_PAREQ
MEPSTTRNVQQQLLKLFAGVPLVLCSGERISHLGECVLLSTSGRRIRLKLDGRAPTLSTDHPTNYESSSWKGLPGERILQYAYRAVPMPVVHREDIHGEVFHERHFGGSDFAEDPCFIMPVVKASKLKLAFRKRERQC